MHQVRNFYDISLFTAWNYHCKARVLTLQNSWKFCTTSRLQYDWSRCEILVVIGRKNWLCMSMWPLGASIFFTYFSVLCEIRKTSFGQWLFDKLQKVISNKWRCRLPGAFLRLDNIAESWWCGEAWWIYFKCIDIAWNYKYIHLVGMWRTP